MKSKFVLHGGFQKSKTYEDNTAFFSEILKDAKDYSRILLVPFAKNPERIAPTTLKVIEEFDKVQGKKNLIFEIASKENFMEQVKSADIIYIQGGTSLKLMGVLESYPHLKDLLLEGKTVAGESAGANALCTVFYSPSADGIYDGLGVLPVKIIPHYIEKYRDEFKDIRPDLESLYLREYEFTVC